MLGDKNRLFDEDKSSFTITHNLWGDDVKEWTEQYRENDTFRQRKQKNQVFLSHEILSWHKDETNITLEKMEDMAREYIQLRNPNALYVATPHMDKNHRHVHLAVSATEYGTGKSMRMSKEQFQELKQNIQAYQKEKYPELSKSIVDHSKKVKALLTDKEYQVKLRTRRASQKEQLIELLNTCYEKASSKENFYELLKTNKLRAYERAGKVSGIYFADKKFRLNRIGFSKERLEELNKMLNREKELKETRGKSKRKNINRSR